MEAEGCGPGGAGGFEKLPDWRRASSSWFSRAAVVPVIASGGWAFIPLWCVEARAGGSADVVPGGATPGTGTGDIAAGEPGYCDAGVPGMPGDPAGRLYSGEEGPGPPGGLTPGPVPVGAVTPGPSRWAEAGATIASAATIATPLNRYFITLILPFRTAAAYPTLSRVEAGALTPRAPFCSGTRMLWAGSRRSRILGHSRGSTDQVELSIESSTHAGAATAPRAAPPSST